MWSAAGAGAALDCSVGGEASAVGVGAGFSCRWRIVLNGIISIEQFGQKHELCINLVNRKKSPQFNAITACSPNEKVPIALL